MQEWAIMYSIIQIPARIQYNHTSQLQSLEEQHAEMGNYTQARYGVQVYGDKLDILIRP